MLNLFEYLIQLPCEVFGHNMLGFLELIDIILFEKAAASHESQQLLKSILPYSPPFAVKHFRWKREAMNWFIKRRCRVQHVTIDVESMCGVNFQHYIFDKIDLCLNFAISLQHLEPLRNPCIIHGVTHVKIKGDQDPAVMELLFSLLTSTNSSVCSLNIVASNLSQWMEHIRKIGPCLSELFIHNFFTKFPIIKTIFDHCPNLEKLDLNYGAGGSKRNALLQTIANYFPHLRSLTVSVSYPSSAEADADLTAFAEKCPQLLEVCLYCQPFTDQSVIALAQHCSRLKKLKLECMYTAASLIALSERGLPLEELDIPMIPIPSAEIAAQCAHALSRIRGIFKMSQSSTSTKLRYAIQYMTGLRELELNSSEDHLLVPHLLLLLQEQCCVGLEGLTICYNSSITAQQFSELVAMCPQLHTLRISKPTCCTHTVLVELARSCPHLQVVELDSWKVTEEGVLTLAVHCRQLRVISISNITVTEETARQLAQHCRHLINLCVYVREGEAMAESYKDYSSKEIRALREIAVLRL